ncbi:AraC family transcriptional regulator [Massilia cavernae]|uniref:AraC family transcriptional regulator n=1 Tax=Massilia cavernae TaxID=2320864 RepID=UPI001E36ACB2|nr:AraC family transcriptional regulator [Massilia cavernae]
METGDIALASVDLASLESLFDALSDVAFFVKDRDGRYLSVNTTMVRRCGLREKADIVGKTALEVHPRPLAQAYMAQDRQVIDQGVAIRKHLELHLYPTRSHGWCLTNKTPLRDANGTIIGLAGTSQDLGLPGDQNPVYGQIANIADHIRAHYADNVSMEELARRAGLSLARVERLFQKVFHYSPRQLLLQTRLSAAMAMIESGSQASIADIAYACGYTDHSAFSRQFKAHTGMSPVQYRAHCHEPGGNS